MYPVSPYAVVLGTVAGAWPPFEIEPRLRATLSALGEVDKLLADWYVAPFLRSPSGHWSVDCWARPGSVDRPYLWLTANRLRLELPQRLKTLQRLASMEKLEAILHALVPIWRPAYAFVAPADWPTLRLMQGARCYNYVGWITLVPASAEQMRELLTQMSVKPFDREHCLVYAVEGRYTKRNRAHNAAVEHLASMLDKAQVTW